MNSAAKFGMGAKTRVFSAFFAETAPGAGKKNRDGRWTSRWITCLPGTAARVGAKKTFPWGKVEVRRAPPKPHISDRYWPSGARPGARRGVANTGNRRPPPKVRPPMSQPASLETCRAESVGPAARACAKAAGDRAVPSAPGGRPPAGALNSALQVPEQGAADDPGGRRPSLPINWDLCERSAAPPRRQGSQPQGNVTGRAQQPDGGRPERARARASTGQHSADRKDRRRPVAQDPGKQQGGGADLGDQDHVQCQPLASGGVPGRQRHPAGGQRQGRQLDQEPDRQRAGRQTGDGGRAIRVGQSEGGQRRRGTTAGVSAWEALATIPTSR